MDATIFINMKSRLFLMVAFLSLIPSICHAYNGVVEVEVGQTFTVDAGSYRNIQSVLWDFDASVFETVSASGYSTRGRFKAISPSPKSGSVIQATIYYHKDGTTSSGVNKDVASWKVYVADDGSESTVSLPISMSLNVGNTKTVTATTSSSKYSGQFDWRSSNSYIVEIVRESGNTAELRGVSAGSTYINVTLDNGNSDRMYVTVTGGSGTGDMTAEVVDLGLSVKWTTCNLGADTPTGAGYDYVWGGTTPSADSSPGATWCDESTLENNGVIKNGHFTPEYDACTQALGSGYRVPTIDEWEELSVNCKWEKLYIGGVPCIKGVSKKNGNVIIMPRTTTMNPNTSIESYALNAWSCTHYFYGRPWAYYAWANLNSSSGKLDEGPATILKDNVNMTRKLRAVYDPSAGIDDIMMDMVNDGTVKIYNLNGVKVGGSTDGLAPGIYIKFQDGRTTKIRVQ